MGVKDELKLRQRDKSRSPASKTPRFNDVRFVNFELDDQQLLENKNHELTLPELSDWLLMLCSDGYGISFRYDDRNECYAAYMSRRDTEHRNSGLMLSARGSSPVKALKQLCYKHFVGLDGDWSEWGEQPRKLGIDD